MINIAERLKDAPKGMKLYSPLFGEVKFVGIDKQSDYPIDVTDSNGNGKSFTKFGVYFADHPDAECLLFPSKDCRTWEGWKPACERTIEIVNDETNYGWISVKDGLPKLKYPSLLSGYCLVALENGIVCNTMVKYSQRGKKWITDDGITIIDVGYWKEIHPPKTNE